MSIRRAVTRSEIDTRIGSSRVEDLKSLVLDDGGDCATAQAALLALLDKDHPLAAAALCQLMIEAKVAVLEPAIIALSERGGPVAYRALGEALSNRDVLVRSAAVRELAQRGARSVVPLLLRASRDPSPAIARRASQSLIRRVVEDPVILTQIRLETAEGIIEMLDLDWAMELLSDAYPEDIRGLAAFRIGRIGGEVATTTLAAVLEVAPPAVAEACWRSLEASGQLSDHLLLPLLFSPDPAVKARALPVYARCADINGAGILSGFTADADSTVRRESLRALDRILGEEALPHAIRLIDDSDEVTRDIALDILVRWPGAEIVLLEVVGKREGEPRRKALGTLAKRGVVTPDLVPHLVQLVLEGGSVTDARDESFWEGLIAAAKALAQNEAIEGLIALVSLCRSVVRRIRRIAIECLMTYPPDLRSDALDSLADSHDKDIVGNVALGLAECNDKRAILPLIRASIESRGRFQREARKLLGQREELKDTNFLVNCLKSKYVTVRRFAAGALKARPDPNAVPGLLEASRDEDVETQLAVFEALSPFASSHNDVLNRMVEAIAYGDITVRQAACEAVGEARCPEAVPELVKALVNCFLRPRAAEALRRIGDRKGVLALKRIERREKMFPKKPKENLAKKGRSVA